MITSSECSNYVVCFFVCAVGERDPCVVSFNDLFLETDTLIISKFDFESLTFDSISE